MSQGFWLVVALSGGLAMGACVAGEHYLSAFFACLVWLLGLRELKSWWPKP